jgi:antitoxin HicB
MATRRPLEDYLALTYPVRFEPDPDVGYVIRFPDLPGCTSHASSLNEAVTVADEIRELWIRGEYEDGRDIPLPSYPEEYSGKLVVRLPRSLHRQLAEEAERQGVSLNQHMVTLLSRGDAQARLERRLAEVEERITAVLEPRAEQPARPWSIAHDDAKAGGAAAAPPKRQRAGARR